MQLGMLLGIDGICDIDLPKKGQNALTYLSVLRFLYDDDPTYEHSYLAGWRI